MFCKKCGNKLNEQDSFCDSCGSELLIGNNSNQKKENNDTANLKRLTSFVYDAIIIEFIFAIFMVMNPNSKDLPLYTYISIIIILVQPIELLIFKKSLGTLLCNFDIKNIDGSKPSRWKFLIQLLIYIAVISINIFSGIPFVDIIIVISIIVCIANKNNRTLFDFILGLQGYKNPLLCNNCGKEINDEQKFCDKCGSKILDIPGKQENIALFLGFLGIIIPLFSIVGFMLAKRSTSNSNVKKIALILNGVVVAILIAATIFLAVGLIYLLITELSGVNSVITISFIILCVVAAIYIIYKIYKELFF